MDNPIFNSDVIYSIVIFIMVLLSGFFSGTEISLVTANRIYLDKLSIAGRKSARRSIAILDRIEDAISMILIGNNLANISATAFITYLATRAFMLDDVGLMAVTSIQTIIFLIFCEVSPKIMARAKAEPFLMFFSYPIQFMIFIFSPLIKFSLIVSNIVKKIFKLSDTDSPLIMSRDEMDTLFRIGRKEGIIGEDHQIFISEILSFKSMTAREIMTPTIDIVSVEANESVKKLVDIIVKTRFSRIPVYEKRVDNIVGYVFYRDLLRNRGVRKISDVINKVHYIPATKKISELYSEMLENLIPIFFVVNEYGAVVGMVTHEDLAEEVVGEIQAKDQYEDELITQVNKKKYILDGNLDIEYFMRTFKVPIEKKGFETLSGFITYRMGKIPKKGDRLKHDKCTFIIEEATERSIEKVVLLMSR